ncbi:ash family protein [Salmonella enterica]|nr:ash family protein [Salmonella enterica]EGP7683108.1 ash family protein [Salmonella enterica]EHP5883686.1 ash family protein [Salmonella enterica]EIH1696777.1 ash family protein [Salmonella enterica]EIS9096448.1 ash family protein [Salmonella enterica]
MKNHITHQRGGLHFTACNVYGREMAWRSSVAVSDHFSTMALTRHAATNGAVCCLPFGAGLPLSVRVNVISRSRNTPRRPAMVLLSGEPLRSPTNLLAGIPTPASNATSASAISPAAKKYLHTDNGLGYVNSAPHKTGAGRSNPKLTKATPDAKSVFFCVRHIRHFMVWCAIHPQGLRCRPAGLLSHHAAHNGAVYCLPFGVKLSHLVRVTVFSLVNSTPHRLKMVALAGQPQGWPVSFVPGIATPVNVTAPIERSNSSGDSLTRTKEAVYHG